MLHTLVAVVVLEILLEVLVVLAEAVTAHYQV
jgi:hypothetical protein